MFPTGCRDRVGWNSPMWTATTRAQHNRDDLRFASDLGVPRSEIAWTDAEWAVLEPLLPQPSPVGRPPVWPMREIVEAIFYVLRGGIARRMLPTCFAPRQTVYGWSAAFRDAGVGKAVNHHRVMLDRECAGQDASPSAAVIDSQSVKTTEAGGPRGDDAGKKVKGRKRHAWRQAPLAPRWTRTAAPSCSRSIRPLCRTATGPCRCSRRRVRASRSSSARSPTVPTPPTGSRTLRASPLRSCASHPVRLAAPSTRAGGSLNGASHG